MYRDSSDTGILIADFLCGPWFFDGGEIKGFQAIIHARPVLFQNLRIISLNFTE